eukprot:6176791-Pleurochrysis_carterae.AAC.3
MVVHFVVAILPLRHEPEQRYVTFAGQSFARFGSRSTSREWGHCNVNCGSGARAWASELGWQRSRGEDHLPE